MTELMVLPESALAAAALRARYKRRGHAGQPGAGPADQTCKSCRWIDPMMGGNRTFSKCGHAMAPKRTHGPATDIRQRDPACERWEALTP